MSYIFLDLISVVLPGMGIIFLISAIMIIALRYHQCEKISIDKYIVGIVGIIMITSGLLASFEQQNILEEKVNERYIVYLDGQEVEAEAVSFTQYNVSINDENEAIYLTQKRERRNHYVPVVIPR